MRKLFTFVLCLLAAAVAAPARDASAAVRPSSAQAGGRQKPSASKPRPAAAKPAEGGEAAPEATPAAEGQGEDEEALNAERAAIKDLPAAERVARLEAFVTARTEGKARARAAELLASARAALGDERLRSGDRVGGVELFTQVVEGTGPETPERLFAEVVSRLPANLYLLGHREEALALARKLEERSAGSARRLLVVAAFYLGAESPDDAARAAAEAVRLAPDSAAAHQALGAAHSQALRIDEAAASFAEALRLDPSAPASRRGLADLRRATGKAEEALALYREQLAADPKDAAARAGYVLSLFESGRREEGEAELRKAFADEPENLQLLVGAAFHFAAEGDGPRALEWADRAVRLEPRRQWVWARLAYARALLVLRRALDAEQAVRLASELGRFPTLDYELATALAAAGLYDEAAQELAKTFALTADGQIETRLAGRTPSRAADFIELLAPERRATIFQHKPADTPANARMLKGLLAFHRAAGSPVRKVDERAAVEAAREFVAGEDDLRAFRQLYVAARLLERGAALPVVVERTEEAIGGVEAALDSPSVVVALLADELHEGRVRARASGVRLDIPAVPRDLLSKILRGRIEDVAGWALYMQGNHAEAVVRLKRAVSVLPEASYWWRSAEWHLGAALDASGNAREALVAYVRAYRLAPDPARRGIIEDVYRRVNGSTEGLGRLLDPQAEPAAAASQTQRPPRRPGPPELTPLQQAQAAGIAAPSPSAASPRASEQRPATDEAPRQSDAETPRQSSPETSPAQSAEPSREGPAPATPERTEGPPAEGPSTRRPADTTNAQPTETTPPPAETTSQPAETTAEPARTRPRGTRTSPRASSAPDRRVPATTGVCAFTFSPNPLSLPSGGTAQLTVSVEGAADLSKLNATTPHWADILVFPEPGGGGEPNTQRFNVSTVSGKPGLYKLLFKLPCGTSEMQVEVK